ncbi:MAG TPA: M23 family metallopeptidase [Steroidobacteraceae bacterium]
MDAGIHDRRRRATIAVTVSALAAVGILAADAGPGPTGPPGISPDTQFTRVAGMVLTSPAPVKASDGKVHIAYELLLTNVLRVEVDINTVEVRDAASKQGVFSLTGSELVAHMNPIGEPPGGEQGDPPIASSATSIVWLDVAVPSMDAVPEAVDHRVVGTVLVRGQPEPFEAIVTRLSISRQKPLVLGPPVAAGTWLASEGCCTNITHHRNGLAPVNGVLSVPQRFAIDFFLLDDQHRTWIGDRTNIHSYLSFGQPAIAASDGTVVVASDGRDDQPPRPHEPPPLDIADTVGNHVIIKVKQGEIDDGDQPGRITRYLLYGHLKKGSIAVEVGQRVHRGDQVGLIGNSGFTSTPHLHFQVLTTPTFYPTDSTPYVFDQFDLVGFETKRIWDDNIAGQPNGTIPFAPASEPFERQLVMPLDRDIVTFSSLPVHPTPVP